MKNKIKAKLDKLYKMKAILTEAKKRIEKNIQKKDNSILNDISNKQIEDIELHTAKDEKDTVTDQFITITEQFDSVKSEIYDNSRHNKTYHTTKKQLDSMIDAININIEHVNDADKHFDSAKQKQDIINSLSTPQQIIIGGGAGGISLKDVRIAGNSLTITPNEDIQEEYNWLKSSSRDARMGALSITNRRTIILSPGVYVVSPRVILDTDFVDIVGIAEKWDTVVKTPALTETGGVVMVQTCDDVTLKSFHIFCDTTESPQPGDQGDDSNGGFWLRGCDNTNSHYYNMAFTITYPDTWSNGCAAVDSTDFLGYWEDCLCNDYGFRISGDIVGSDKIFGPTMRNCHTIDHWDSSGVKGLGTYSFCGDGLGAYETVGGGQILPATIGVSMEGTYHGCTGDFACFSGCLLWSAPISNEATFYDCVGGDHSFAISAPNAGTFTRCVAGKNSFGGGNSDADPQWGFGLFSGDMYDCRRVGEDDEVWIVLGSVSIHNSYLKTTKTNADCLILFSSGANFYNNTIIANGSGKSINAGSAIDVISAHNRMNAALGSNVTNLVTTHYDVIDAAII